MDRYTLKDVVFKDYKKSVGLFLASYVLAAFGSVFLLGAVLCAIITKESEWSSSSEKWLVVGILLIIFLLTMIPAMVLCAKTIKAKSIAKQVLKHGIKTTGQLFYEKGFIEEETQEFIYSFGRGFKYCYENTNGETVVRQANLFVGGVSMKKLGYLTRIQPFTVVYSKEKDMYLILKKK